MSIRHGQAFSRHVHLHVILSAMNEATASAPQNSSRKFLLSLVAIAAIFALVGVFAYMRYFESSEVAKEEEVVPVAYELAASRGSGRYPNGVYSTLGTYAPHGMDTQIEVTITLENDTITSSDVVLLSKNPTSVRITERFDAAYKEFVIGKPIQGLQLDTIAGSSLTPEGYNAALRQIETYAETL